MDIFKKFNLNRDNELSKIFVESATNIEYTQGSEFQLYNKKMLDALDSNDLCKYQKYIDFYSDLIVSESCKYQETELYQTHEKYQTNFICVDRELSMKGSYSWLHENWVSNFGNLALNLNNKKQLKARLVRIHIFDNLEKIVLDNIEINNISTILKYTNRQGFINIIASEKILKKSDIDIGLADIWMIPFNVLVLNTPPLYLAQIYYKDSEYKEVLEKYSSFFLDIIEQTILGSDKYSQLIQANDSADEIKNKIKDILKND